MKKFLSTGLAAFLLLAVIGCGGSSGGSGDGTGDQYPRFSSSDNEMVNFSFPVSKNKNLSGDVKGVINGSDIKLEVSNSTDVTSLVAEYTSNSSKVEVNGTLQKSGVTKNNFTKPVNYTVTAENGDKNIYSVVVHKALSGEKNFTSFSINGIEGKIDQSAGSVSLEFAPHTNLNSLKASFSSAAKKVTVGDTVQISGVTENNFSMPVKYAVTAEDGSKKEYTVTAALLPDTAKEIFSFGFLGSDNPSLKLSADVSGLISGTDIKVELPYGSDNGLLKAFFESSGKKVEVNNLIQQSGITENNFSAPVEYIVTAENGDKQIYTVTVTVALNNAKAISQFVLDGETAFIDENTRNISVKFPASKDLKKLTASYVSSGVTVTVGGTFQASGVTENNFSEPVKYTVTAEDGSSVVYTVNVEKIVDIAGLWNFEYGSDGSYVISGAVPVPGILGQALYFDKGNYVSVPDSEFLTLRDAGSIEVVFKAGSHQPFAGIVHKGVNTDFSDESYSLQFWGNNGNEATLRFSMFNDAGGYDYVESSTKILTDKWYYVAAVWDASEIIIYVNGKNAGSINKTIGAVKDSAGDLIIGAQLPVEYNSSWSNLVFNGTIDRVQISGRALSEAEITAKYIDMKLETGSVLTDYIVAVAAENYTVIGGILGALILVLISIFVYNKKREKMLD